MLALVFVLPFSLFFAGCKEHEHTNTIKYKLNDGGEVIKYEECSSCHEQTEGEVYTEYISVTPENLATITFTNNNCYVFTGTFSNVIINAENTTLIARENTKFSSVEITENANNTTIYNFNVANSSIKAYADTTVSKCFNLTYGLNFYIHVYKPNLNIVVDSCEFENASYGIHFGFHDATATDTNIAITNCTMTNIELYAIFLQGVDISNPDNLPRLGTVYVNKNTFTDWGIAKKRAIFKINSIAGLNRTDGSTEDVFDDATILTNGAKDFVRKIMSYDNTYSNINDYSVFNIENACLTLSASNI